MRFAIALVSTTCRRTRDESGFRAARFHPVPEKRTCCRSVSSDRVAAWLEVRDTGVGISPGALPHLFERFYRVENGLSARGAGLGLALAKWIADRHGATIGLTSRLGEGSTFTVRLPLAFRAGSSSLPAQAAR